MYQPPTGISHVFIFVESINWGVWGVFWRGDLYFGVVFIMYMYFCSGSAE